MRAAVTRAFARRGAARSERLVTLLPSATPTCRCAELCNYERTARGLAQGPLYQLQGVHDGAPAAARGASAPLLRAGLTDACRTSSPKRASCSPCLRTRRRSCACRRPRRPRVQPASRVARSCLRTPSRLCAIASYSHCAGRRATRHVAKTRCACSGIRVSASHQVRTFRRWTASRRRVRRTPSGRAPRPAHSMPAACWSGSVALAARHPRTSATRSRRRPAHHRARRARLGAKRSTHWRHRHPTGDCAAARLSSARPPGARMTRVPARQPRRVASARRRAVGVCWARGAPS